MKNLLRTVLRKYFRGKMTLIFTLLALLSGIAMGFLGCPRRLNSVQTFRMDWYIYLCTFTMLLCIVGAVLTAGGVCADGAVRNQCIAGYTKSQIFCAQVFGASAWGLCNGVLTVLPFYFIGQAFFLRCAEGQAFRLLLPVVLGFPLAALFAAALAMAIHQKALSVVICMAVSIMLYFSGTYYMMRLDEPKYRKEIYEYNDEISEVMSKNTEYIDPPARQIIEFANLVSPTAGMMETGWYLLECAESEYYSIPDAENFADHFAKYKQQLPEAMKEAHRRHDARRKTIIWFQVTLLCSVTAAGTWLYRWRNLK